MLGSPTIWLTSYFINREQLTLLTTLEWTFEVKTLGNVVKLPEFEMM